MSATTDNLKAAFAGESQANRKYLAFAKKAEEDGYPQVAKLFRAAAEAETIHAHAHLKVLNGVSSTADNLKEAIGGENYEHTTMYPGFIEQARKDGNWTRYARSPTPTGEKIHENKYIGAADAVAGQGPPGQEAVHLPRLRQRRGGAPPGALPGVRNSRLRRSKRSRDHRRKRSRSTGQPS